MGNLENRERQAQPKSFFPVSQEAVDLVTSKYSNLKPSTIRDIINADRQLALIAQKALGTVSPSDSQHYLNTARFTVEVLREQAKLNGTQIPPLPEGYADRYELEAELSVINQDLFSGKYQTPEERAKIKIMDLIQEGIDPVYGLAISGRAQNHPDPGVIFRAAVHSYFPLTEEWKRLHQR